jgi:hypothetical protein
MKPIFTIHAGEFLVGDYINRKFGRKYDVWVPTKDIGIDLLVTRKRRQGKAVGIQVKFSRAYSIREELARHLIATSWFMLDLEHIRKSNADLWVFVIMTLNHTQHFVLVPRLDLRRRIPHNCGKKWNVYLWVYDNGSCYQVRGLNPEEQLAIASRGVRDPHRNFSEWLERWEFSESYTR